MNPEPHKIPPLVETPVRRARLIGGLLAAALSVTPASGHQTFLFTDKFHWNSTETVEVALTSALSFPNREHGPAQDRLAFTHISINGDLVKELTFEESETSLAIKFSPNHAGLAIVAASSKPRTGEIAPEDVEEYLSEIEADMSVRRAFDALPGSPALDRSYGKHAKTFICIETCDDGYEAASNTLGQKLEFVASDTGGNSFRLLLDGEPLADQTVTVVSADGHASKALTDQAGMIDVSDSISGVIMLSAVWITLPEKPDGVYHSDYATLTAQLNKQP